MKAVSFPVVLLLAIAASSTGIFATAASNEVSGCSGTKNTIPMAAGKPTFVKKVSNGKMYNAGEGNDTFAILHLWGTPYEQGYAQGQLRSAELQGAWPQFTAWIDSEIEKKEPSLPKSLISLIVDFGIVYLLEWNYNITVPFTPQLYIDEMQGIADGAGIDVKIIQNMNMFPELTKAACTIVGATKGATSNQQIQHLRALDFSPHCPFKDQSQLTVYHGNQGVTVANFGWMGLIGSLTGISNTSIGIGEKVWLGHDKGISGRRGTPWMFLLRDVLMKSNIDEALNYLENANRTCAIHVGIGDSTTNEFRGVTMAERAFDIYNWSTLNYTAHPALEHIVYWNKYLQPSSNPCLGNLLQKYYGEITADVLAFDVAAISETGDMQAVSFDYGNQTAYYANARRTWDSEGHLSAYARRFTEVNLKDLWGEQQQ